MLKIEITSADSRTKVSKAFMCFPKSPASKPDHGQMLPGNVDGQHLGHAGY